MTTKGQETTERTRKPKTQTQNRQKRYGENRRTKQKPSKANTNEREMGTTGTINTKI